MNENGDKELVSCSKRYFLQSPEIGHDNVECDSSTFWPVAVLVLHTLKSPTQENKIAKLRHREGDYQAVARVCGVVCGFCNAFCCLDVVQFIVSVDAKCDDSGVGQTNIDLDIVWVRFIGEHCKKLKIEEEKSEFWHQVWCSKIVYLLR